MLNLFIRAWRRRRAHRRHVYVVYVALRFQKKQTETKPKNGDGEGFRLHVVSGVAVTEQMYLFENFPGVGWGGGWRLNTEELTEGLSRRRIAVKSEQEHPQG